MSLKILILPGVALRKESVDRNLHAINRHNINRVALRKESVDRNRRRGVCHSHAGVALRKESVDRNHDEMLRYRDAEQSLSARRAWIEINNVETAAKASLWSLSARRAWIEMPTL